MRISWVFTVFLTLSIATQAWPQVLADDPKHIVDDGLFIAPNEFNFDLFKPHLKGRDGVLIGVGTFRMFQSASQGDFSHLICLDYDLSVVVFNRWLIQLLRESDDRVDFLSRILGSARFKKKFQDYESGKMTFDQLIAELNANKAAIVASMRAANPAIRSDDGNFDRFFDRVFTYIYKMGSITFLGSDQAFRKLKALADAGNIEALQGNIGGDKTLLSLAAKLKSRGLGVSVFDLSNAFDFLLEHDRLRFFANLKSLPMQNDALVFFTDQGPEDLQKHFMEDGWRYHALPASTYIRRLERIFQPQKDRMISRTDYFQFLDKSALPAPVTGAHACIDVLVMTDKFL